MQKTSNPTLITSGTGFPASEVAESPDAEAQGLMDDLETVIDMALGTKPDFSAVTDTIHRARRRAATQQAHRLSQTVMDVGIAIAADFETQAPDQEDDDVYLGW